LVFPLTLNFHDGRLIINYRSKDASINAHHEIDVADFIKPGYFVGITAETGIRAAEISLTLACFDLPAGDQPDYKFAEKSLGHTLKKKHGHAHSLYVNPDTVFRNP
jgi:hypothetical protein